MNNKTRMFDVAVLILAFVTAVILGLVTSPANPFTWLLLVLVLVLPEYQFDQDTAMQNTIDFLQGWLIRYINGTDKKYSKFLIERSVK